MSWYDLWHVLSLAPVNKLSTEQVFHGSKNKISSLYCLTVLRVPKANNSVIIQFKADISSLNKPYERLFLTHLYYTRSSWKIIVLVAVTSYDNCFVVFLFHYLKEVNLCKLCTQVLSEPHLNNQIISKLLLQTLFY